MRLSSFQRFESDLKSEISDLRFEIEIDLSKFGKSVDRRQYLATEATRPSGASTVETDRTPRSVALFCGTIARQKRYGPVAQLVERTPDKREVGSSNLPRPTK